MTKVYLGTESYPLIDSNEKSELGARAGNMPIELDVNLTAPNGIDLNDYVYGMYIRNLSTRSMLPAINSEFDRRNQLNDKSLKTYASGFLGAPGTGKTFFFNNVGKMQHERGAILVDCSDKDLKTLFENPTFDSKSANREKAAIDAKIVMRNKGMEGGLSDASLEKLRTVMGAALIEDENGMVTADWSGIAFEGNDLAEQEHSVQVFQSMLREVCKAEGIELSKESSEVGIVMQDGELYRVFDPQSPDYGRPIILDELNRARFGTMDNLYGLLNFLNSPNMSAFTIRGANGKELVLDKKNIPSTFFLNFTGNQAVDGMGSQSFNDPFLSRVPEGFSLRTIPDTTANDISDMISSYLLGVPGTILFDAFSVDGKSQRSLQDFISFLKTARTIGLTKKEIDAIPQWQMYNINNAGKIIALSRQMGRFFYEIKALAQRRAPYDKITTGKGEELLLEPGYEAFLATKNVDFRIVPRFFIEADILKGEVTSMRLPKLGAVKGTSSAAIVSEKERYATRGNRLENVMREWLEITFVPQDMGVRKIEEKTTKAMLDKAKQIAYQNGVLPATTKEAKTNQTRIADLYNIEVAETGSYHKRLQAVISNVLRDKYPEIAKESDEEILPLSVVSATIQTIADDKSSTLQTAYKAKNLLVLNEDVDEVSQQMLGQAEVVADTNAPTISAENLLVALSLDETKSMNLEHVFQIPKGAESGSDFKAYGVYNDKQANVKCSFCRVLGKDNNPSYMFVFYNKDTDNLIVVGDDVSQEALKFFSKKNRIYLNRNEVSADELQNKVTNLVSEDQIMMVETMLSGYMKWETSFNLGGMLAKPSKSYQQSEVTNATVFKPSYALANKRGR